MFKGTTAVLAGLACCLTLPALSAGTDMGCVLPPLTQDYLRKTVRVEIKGKLYHIRMWLEGPRDPKYPMPNVGLLDYWQITTGGKTFRLEFPERKLLTDEADRLAGKSVILAGTLAGDTIHVTGLKADEEYIKQTTEVEAHGQLSAVTLETIQPRIPPIVAWNFVVNDKTYPLTFATPELENLAKTLDGKTVVLTGTLDNDTITVQTLKAAQ
jgi:hypothetical protein